jgi:hypothetical protein
MWLQPAMDSTAPGSLIRIGVDGAFLLKVGRAALVVGRLANRNL